MADGYWVEYGKDLNDRIKALRARITAEPVTLGGGWASQQNNDGWTPEGTPRDAWTSPDDGLTRATDDRGVSWLLEPQYLGPNPEFEAELAELLKERKDLPALIAKEAKEEAEYLKQEAARLEAERVEAEKKAAFLAEDIQLKERAQTQNLKANDTLARMNQQQAAKDAQISSSRQGSYGTSGRGVGVAYDLDKQRSSELQKVGAASSASPTVSAFAGKAAAVSPVNATSQTANTGIMQGTNKALYTDKFISEKSNKDESVGNLLSQPERSKAVNLGKMNSFNPPSMQGIQIGESPINKFGGT